MARLSEQDACGFEELFADVNSRGGMIVTFLALLEMIRTRAVRVFQAGMFGAIRVYKRAGARDSGFGTRDSGFGTRNRVVIPAKAGIHPGPPPSRGRRSIANPLAST